MRLVRHLQDMPVESTSHGSVVTIGSFDGLHPGHHALLEKVQQRAKIDGLTSIVMSFEPTPREFFQADAPPARLMRFREKFDALSKIGIDIFYCPRFSPEMRSVSAVDFVRRILVQGLDAREIVVGDDFRFARQREGDTDLLEKLGAALGFGVTQVHSVRFNGLRVSSSVIREACEAGDMPLVTRLLGRPYSMSGRVVRGEGMGRKLGFPTANVDLRRRQSPVSGIYAVRVRGLGKKAVDGVASVGSRPTFDGDKPLLEVHLFDFAEDIYGRYIQTDFIERLRGQIRYDDVADLVAQMHLDAKDAQQVLEETANGGNG